MVRRHQKYFLILSVRYPYVQLRHGSSKLLVRRPVVLLINIVLVVAHPVRLFQKKHVLRLSIELFFLGLLASSALLVENNFFLYLDL